MSRVTATGSQPANLEPTPEATTEAPPPATSASGASTSPAKVTVEAYRDTMGQVNSSLTRTWRDVIISDRDVAKVHDALEKLPPLQYKQALDEMEKSGLLTAYLAELSPAAEKRFLQQAVAKGWLKDAPIPIKPDYDPTGRAYEPPAVPRLIQKERWMPGPLREAIDRDFTDKRVTYEAEYARYMERYMARLNLANHPSTIRELGPAANAIGFPGMIARYEHDLVKARAEKFNELMGRVPAGLVVQSRTAGVVRYRSAEHKAELEITRQPNGKIESKATSGTEVDLKGKTLRVGTDDSQDLRVGAGPFEGTLSPKGKVELEITPGVGRYNQTGVEGGAKVVAEPESATLMGGVTVEAKIGPLKLEQDVLFGFRGVQKETADRVASPGGIFDPPELGQGVPWAALKEDRRRELSVLHSEKSWAAALEARQRGAPSR